MLYELKRNLFTFGYVPIVSFCICITYQFLSILHGCQPERIVTGEWPCCQKIQQKIPHPSQRHQQTHWKRSCDRLGWFAAGPLPPPPPKRREVPVVFITKGWEVVGGTIHTHFLVVADVRVCALRSVQYSTTCTYAWWYSTIQHLYKNGHSTGMAPNRINVVCVLPFHA